MANEARPMGKTEEGSLSFAPLEKARPDTVGRVCHYRGLSEKRKLAKLGVR